MANKGGFFYEEINTIVTFINVMFNPFAAGICGDC